MKFTTTAVPNLLKGENGAFYLRARIRGRLIWRSLETNVFSVAKLRLPDKYAELRVAVGAIADEVQVSRKLKFHEALELYRAQVLENPRLRPATKEFRLRPETTLRRTWPALFDMELRRITPEACQAWQNRFEGGGSSVRIHNTKARTLQGNSSTTVNACIAFLRRIFEIGVRHGIMYRNPAQVLVRKQPPRKLLRLPNRSQFAAVVLHIRSQFGWGRKAGDLVEGLAYSGMRVGEASRLLFNHVDLEKNLLTIPGEKTEAAPRIVPMTPDFRDLIDRLRKRRSPAPTDFVFQTRSVLGSLATACAAVGVPKLTHHDLRHLFATTCIESGVDVPTVALWLGHADGGALAMRTYGHIRPEHSVEAAKKVIFRPNSMGARIG